MIAPEWFYPAVVGIASLAFGIGVRLGRSVERQKQEAAIRQREFFIRKIEDTLKDGCSICESRLSYPGCLEYGCTNYKALNLASIALVRENNKKA